VPSHARMCLYVRVCACVRARLCARMCVCVCVTEKNIDRKIILSWPFSGVTDFFRFPAKIASRISVVSVNPFRQVPAQ